MTYRQKRRATDEEIDRACRIRKVARSSVAEAWVDEAGVCELVLDCFVEKITANVKERPMTENRQYTDAVAAGLYPSSSQVPLDDRFTDVRGEILNVLFTDVRSVARIGSKRGAVRANHWHRTDWHYALVEYGRVLYFERAVGDTTMPTPQVFTPGQMFFTPPNREHAMLFLEDSVIYTFAKNVRTHEEHEADLVRVELVTPEIAERFVGAV